MKKICRNEVIDRWIYDGRTYNDLTASERDYYCSCVFGSDCSREAIEAINERLFGILLSELHTASNLPSIKDIVNSYSVLVSCLGID